MKFLSWLLGIAFIWFLTFSLHGCGDKEEAEREAKRVREIYKALADNSKERQAKCDPIKDLLAKLKTMDDKPVECVRKQNFVNSSCLQKYHWDVELRKHGSSYREMLSTYLGKQYPHGCEVEMNFIKKHGMEVYKDAKGWVGGEIKEAEERGREEGRELCQEEVMDDPSPRY